MLESVLGEETFLRGLRSYLTKHMYGNAETDDLWAAMTQEVFLTLSSASAHHSLVLQ